jgi:hypothetical protein
VGWVSGGHGQVKEGRACVAWERGEGGLACRAPGVERQAASSGV